jgi:multicomponent K+:H+ antiporter subunit E
MSLLSRPRLSLAVLLVWLLVTNVGSPGSVLLGVLLALALPPLAAPFWPAPPRPGRPLRVARLAGRVAADILVANLGVARRVLGSPERLRPAFVEVPLALRDPFVATVLASIVSLTPGTVAIDVDQRRWALHVHALDAPDPAALAELIRARYEAPLREIFAC